MSFHAPLADVAAYEIKLAETRSEHAAAAELRRVVFCVEQQIFDGDDRDATDDHANTIIALSPAGDVVGTVRIHQEVRGIWWGSRLAVDQRYRRVAQLGAGLIRCAVSTANGRGCKQFLAHVQVQNEPLFHRLQWQSLAYEDQHGLPHVKMQADLDAYPAGMDPLPQVVPAQ